MDLTTITTPVDVSVFSKYLQMSNFDPLESAYLIESFEQGFDIGYRGPTLRQDEANNIPFSVGNKLDMWEKLMKEVKLGRVAGPFTKIPYCNYMQSPIGLVPKAGDKTRLIFHLSYQFKSGLGSLNSNTPADMCSVKYDDLDTAVKKCLELLAESDIDTQILFFGKSDLVSAFRVLPCKINQFRWMIMKAWDPETNKLFYFVNKSIPFGSSVSCSHFQRVSSALCHVVRFLTGRRGVVMSYLDDFLFVDLSEEACNELLDMFTKLCRDINFPVAIEKTERASPQIIFLGIMLDGVSHVLVIPEDKRLKALNLLQWICAKKKVTIKLLQQLAGTLNFLHKAIHPGRAFTRRMYAKFAHIMDHRGKLISGTKMRQHYHVALDTEFRDDCAVWELFLMNKEISTLCRPFLDVDIFKTSKELDFTTDAAAGEHLGAGCVFGTSWTSLRWPSGFMRQVPKPSIEFLELYALVMAVYIWSERLSNTRSIIFCDNEAVCKMVVKNSSSCKNCMYLIRMLVLRSLQYNMRIFTKHIFGKDNLLADILSRQRLDIFRRIAPQMNSFPERIPHELWPITKVWQQY